MCANVAVRRCLGLLFLAICTTVGSFAQLGKGTISGTITDPQGAAVAGASVIIVNTSTNAEFRPRPVMAASTQPPVLRLEVIECPPKRQVSNAASETGSISKLTSTPKWISSWR